MLQTEKRSQRPSAVPTNVIPRGRSGGVSVRVRPRVLCVDDEPMLLTSLAATLRKQFEVVPANGAREAFALLERDPELRVVISDYRMPGMDGGAFLAKVREQYPTVVRMLLSGAGAENLVTEDADLVFRLLEKPCPRDTLVSAIEDAFRRFDQP